MPVPVYDFKRFETVKPEVAKEKEEQKKIEAEKTAAVFEGGGQKYSHSKFGVGVVASDMIHMPMLFLWMALWLFVPSEKRIGKSSEKLFLKCR